MLAGTGTDVAAHANAKQKKSNQRMDPTATTRVGRLVKLIMLHITTIAHTVTSAGVVAEAATKVVPTACTMQLHGMPAWKHVAPVAGRLTPIVTSWLMLQNCLATLSAASGASILWGNLSPNQESIFSMLPEWTVAVALLPDVNDGWVCVVEDPHPHRLNGVFFSIHGGLKLTPQRNQRQSF